LADPYQWSRAVSRSNRIVVIPQARASGTETIIATQKLATMSVH
jgi:hypothetical protein